MALIAARQRRLKVRYPTNPSDKCHCTTRSREVLADRLAGQKIAIDGNKGSNGEFTHHSWRWSRR
jgi:hypothetical protein